MGELVLPGIQYIDARVRKGHGYRGDVSYLEANSSRAQANKYVFGLESCIHFLNIYVLTGVFLITPLALHLRFTEKTKGIKKAIGDTLFLCFLP